MVRFNLKHPIPPCGVHCFYTEKITDHIIRINTYIMNQSEWTNQIAQFYPILHCRQLALITSLPLVYAPPVATIPIEWFSENFGLELFCSPMDEREPGKPFQLYHLEGTILQSDWSIRY